MTTRSGCIRRFCKDYLDWKPLMTLTRRLGERVLEKSGGQCFYCGERLIWRRETKVKKRIRREFVVDHFVPKRRGGTDRIENLVPACWNCNSSKGPKTISEFRDYEFRREYGWPFFTVEQLNWLESKGIELPPKPYFYFWFEENGWRIKENLPVRFPTK
ncbi:MAG: hypothetical protein GC152_08220 [Alphaproteobacteria bacterium]|nr:hypothetical protein [Alphaproteobacteria bacterium]